MGSVTVAAAVTAAVATAPTATTTAIHAESAKLALLLLLTTLTAPFILLKRSMILFARVLERHMVLQPCNRDANLAAKDACERRIDGGEQIIPSLHVHVFA